MRNHNKCLLVAFVWMALSAVAVGALQLSDYINTFSSAVYWLAIGVMPPSLAMWRLPPED